MPDIYEDLVKKLDVKDASELNVPLFVPTGSLSVDYAVGRPGIPVGRLTEILGDVATGKSFLGYNILANTQKLGGIAILVDFENAIDPTFAAVSGLDLSKCILLNPPHLEDFFDKMDQVLETVKEDKSESFVTVLVDSIAAAPVKAEVDGDIKAFTIGLKARVLSLALRRLTPRLVTERVALVFINQLREKIGVLFGPKWTTPGGLAIPYHSSLRLKMKKSKDIKNSNDEICGFDGKVTVIKNKVAPPFKIAPIKLYFDKGFDNIEATLQLSIAGNLIKKSAGWYQYGDEKKFQARQFEEMLASNQKLREEVKECLGSYLETYMPTTSRSLEELPTENQSD